LAFKVVTMCFRIQRWSLKKDWSVQIEAQTVTASMYDLDVGPKPMDVVPAPLPALFYPIPLGPVWAPYQVQAFSSDALFPSEWTFDSDQEYTTLADGSALASLIVTGKLPVNEFSATGAGAPGIGSISQSATGGSLAADVTLWVAICAIDSNGLPSAPSNIAIIGTGTAAGGSFTLNDITWPAVSGLASYVLFVGTQPDLICEQATGTLTAGSGNTYTPASITFGGPVVRSTWALPSPYVAKVRIKAKLLVHSGVAGVAVTTVSTNTLVCSELVDTSSTPFSPVGRILSVIGRPNGSTPFASFNITAFVPTTGTITLDRDPTGTVNIGDAVVIRNQASGLSSTPTAVTQVTDPGYQNIANSYGGLAVSAEVGNLIRVIAGTGRGQTPSTITANTSTQLSFQPPLLMDDTSIWIVEAPAWSFQADSTSIDNANPLTPVSLSVPTANFIDQPMLIAGFTVDVNGNESPDGDQPFREDWIYGEVGAPSGEMKISIPGTLAIGSDLGPAAFYTSTVSLQNGVTCMVKQAPIGADLVVEVYAGTTLLFTVTIAAGTTVGSATGTPAIGPETPVIINLTAVGTTFPGSDLTVALS
jgi:hypothetical protein